MGLLCGTDHYYLTDMSKHELTSLQIHRQKQLDVAARYQKKEHYWSYVCLGNI